jgi:hypothetical protein
VLAKADILHSKRRLMARQHNTLALISSANPGAGFAKEVQI